ncbi:MAG TPA: hypothetical protein VE992_00550 [Solirubrobacteraceae bacterium]|nr:hypothetical protein [Solirubrobacteraceae bacterium]
MRVSRRSTLIVLVAAGIALFLIISALLARAFSVDGAERSAITAVVQAEARGDAAAVIARLSGCGSTPACRARATDVARRLRHPGTVDIIQIQSSSGFSLTGTLGTARVAWNVGGSLPIVQCVRVRHAGNVLSGLRVELLALSERLHPSSSPCPARF